MEVSESALNSDDRNEMLEGYVKSPLGADDLKRNLIGNTWESGSGNFSIEDSDDEEVSEHSAPHEDELFGLDENSSNSQRFTVLAKQAIPVVISFFLSVGGTFINLIFAGQYVHESGDKSTVFAGVSLANMFANVSCLSVLIGMSSAVETLGSQHNGAGNYKEVGIVLQRSYLILGFLTLPIIILWFYTSDIFLALGVERDVCIVIRNFIRIRALTIPVDVINESYEKYLMSIGVMQPSMWANIAFNVFILLFDLLFVYGFHLDYECLAWSWVLSIYLSSIIQVALSWNHPAVQRTLQPWDWAAWYGWYEFILLGLPGTVMLCSEWWAYEILTIFASLLGTAQVAAQTIIMQTASLAFMVPLGIGVASASLVGNSLGASKKQLAIQLGKLSLISILVLEIFIGLIMLVGGSFFVDCFTNDERVKSVANRAIPFLCLFTTIDGIQGVSSGVLRGAGKQFIGAVANLIAFYAIGLPMAWYLCFTCDFGVNGLMMGIAFGTIFQVVVLVVLIVYFEEYVYSSDIAKHVTATASLLPTTASISDSTSKSSSNSSGGGGTSNHKNSSNSGGSGGGVFSPNNSSNGKTQAKTAAPRKTKNGFRELAGDDHDHDDEENGNGASSGKASIAMVSLLSKAATAAGLPGRGGGGVGNESNDDYIRL